MTDNHDYYNRKHESDQFHESHDVNTSEVIQAPVSERTDPPAPKPESTPDNRNKRPPEETSSGGEQVDRDANPPNQSPPDDDPFAPEKLKLSQNFEALSPTKHLRTTIKVDKPSKEAFVRVSTDPAYWADAHIIELTEPRQETYWVVPALIGALQGEKCFIRVKLALGVDRNGTPFIWRIKLPSADGRKQPWVDSMLQILERAKTEWVRVYWSDATKAYEARIAEGNSAPQWPTETFSELLRIAFKDRVIDRLDHPVIKELYGRD